jgi:hypothetical protein
VLALRLAIDGSRGKEGDGLVASRLRQTVSLQAPHPSSLRAFFLPTAGNDTLSALFGKVACAVAQIKLLNEQTIVLAMRPYRRPAFVRR